MKTTELSNYLIDKIGKNVDSKSATVSNLPIPQLSETTDTFFRVIVQVTYNQTDFELIGVGVTKNSEYSANQALISSFLNGSNVTVKGTPLMDKMDPFTSTAKPMVDFVWVVDNSGSMWEEQTSVSQNSLRFFNILQNKHLDYRLGVIATGHSNYSCDTDGNAYKLWGTGWTTSINGASAFQSNVNSVGLDGCGAESGVHWAKVALEKKTVSPRAGAKLVFVLLSDEGDNFGYFNGSYSWWGWTAEVFNTTSNIFTQNKYLWYSIIGLDSKGNPGTCKSLSTSALEPNNSDPTYFNLANATEGSSSSICNADYSSILENIATQSAAASSDYKLKEKPISSTIVVKVDRQTITQNAMNGWMYNSSSNTIVLSGTAWPDAGKAIEVTYKYEKKQP